nr:hypothetical protein [Candidatus Cloacimonadota bacterium]
MKKFIILIFITGLCSSLCTETNENSSLILQRIENNQQNFARNIGNENTKNIDDYVLKRWISEDFKNYNVHKVEFRDIEFKASNNGSNDLIIIGSEDYFIGSKIPANTKRFTAIDDVRAYTLFNVLYYLEKSYTRQIITLSASTLGVIIPTIASIISYNSYNNTKSSS